MAAAMWLGSPKVLSKGRVQITITSEWNRSRKKAAKISEHLGTITLDGVFVEKSVRQVRESRRRSSSARTGRLCTRRSWMRGRS